MEFRSDINGLRAIAVLSVLLYHFGIPGIHGGFAGVDVFFVLSGFLMTSIILGGIERGNFSLGQFYLSRARRILPALLTVCFALLVFGWFWIAPTEYMTLGKHSGSAASFISNFVFKDEEGYFDAPSQAKWLLHTWSLSVEWQFYIIFPLVLLAFQRFISSAPKHTNHLLWILGTASLGACIITSGTSPVFTFYMLPTRMWEMIMGGLAWRYAPFLTLTNRQRKIVYITGMASILVSAVFFNAQMEWPGFYALLPTLGTVAVIFANQQQFRMLNNRAVQALGRWSYSIYLWHWPLVVGITYFGRKEDAAWIAVAIVASVIAGALSYRVIEQPTRRYFSTRHWHAGVLASLSAIIIINAAGICIGKKEGFPSRLNPEIAAIDQEGRNIPHLAKDCGFDRNKKLLKPCIIGNEKDIRWVVWGDSHVAAIVSALHQSKTDGIQYYSHQCSPVFDSEMRGKHNNNNCTAFMQEAWKQVEQLPTNAAVIIINRYSVQTRGPNERSRPWGIHYNQLTPEEQALDADSLYHKRVVENLCRMQKSRRVFAVLPIPEMGVDVPRTMARQAITHTSDISTGVTRAAYDERNQVVLDTLQDAHKKCGITLIDPTSRLCKEGFCSAETDGLPRYSDDNHLNATGIKTLVPLFTKLK